jgi:asparagine synthase (glutamine-hydrolysing)
VATFALEEGVEVRSPLFDDRIIRFAARRPRAERTDGTETKRLLRAAMRGLLPEHVLASRAHRTGTTGYYFARSLRAALPALLEGPGREPLLGELGVVDPGMLRRCADEYLRGSQSHLGLPLFLTLQTELWLRAHLRRPASAPRWSGSMALAEMARAT